MPSWKDPMDESSCSATLPQNGAVFMKQGYPLSAELAWLFAFLALKRWTHTKLDFEHLCGKGPLPWELREGRLAPRQVAGWARRWVKTVLANPHGSCWMASQWQLGMVPAMWDAVCVSHEKSR